MVVAKFKQILTVSKQAAQRFDGERFNLRKLNELEVRKEYQIEITNRCAALEILSDDEDIKRAWENMKENIRTSATECLGLQELKHHKPWFYEEVLGFLDQRKQTKLQRIHDPNQSNLDNVNNVRSDASRHFESKMKTYLKTKIEELETKCKIKNIMDLYRDSRRVTTLELI